MKKSLLVLLAWAACAVAANGPQPLFISNVTFLPDGCNDNPNTFTLRVTASGGTPNASGQYTYQLQGQADQVAQIAEFTQVTADGTVLSLVVKDSANNSVPYTISGTASASDSISMNIDSLPLGGGQGCITLNVVSTEEPVPTEVQLSVAPAGSAPEVQTIGKAPYTKTFSAPASVSLKALVTQINDCDDGENSVFSITFQFPQGLGNAMKTYLFNKYCSCALQSSTVAVTP